MNRNKSTSPGSQPYKSLSPDANTNHSESSPADLHSSVAKRGPQTSDSSLSPMPFTTDDMDKLFETMTESQLETLFKSSGAFNRMRDALAEKILDHTDDTRAATQKLIADNPNADARWVINKTPSQIMVNTERKVRKELDQIMRNADNKAQIHRLFQKELLGIRAPVSPSSSLYSSSVSQNKIVRKDKLRKKKSINTGRNIENSVDSYLEAILPPTQHVKASSSTRVGSSNEKVDPAGPSSAQTNATSVVGVMTCQESSRAIPASAKATPPITMTDSSNVIEVFSNTMVGPSSLTSATASSVTAMSGQETLKKVWQARRHVKQAPLL